MFYANPSFSSDIWLSCLVPLFAIIIVWLISIPGNKNMPTQYQQLKVPFRLPNAFFGYGWAIMYILFAVAWGYSIYRLGSAYTIATGILLLATNVIWVYLFAAKQYIWALLPLFVSLFILILVILYLGYMRLWFPCLLFVIYFLWLCLATYQSFYVALYN